MRIVGYDLLGKEIFTAATHQQAADRAVENLPCVTHDTAVGVVWPYTRWVAPEQGGCVVAIGTPFSTWSEAKP